MGRLTEVVLCLSLLPTIVWTVIYFHDFVRLLFKNGNITVIFLSIEAVVAYVLYGVLVLFWTGFYAKPKEGHRIMFFLRVQSMLLLLYCIAIIVGLVRISRL
jgi:hypothetical protein